MDHYQFIFESLAEDQKDILVAKLDEIGFTGFEEEAGTLKAFISTQSFQQEMFDTIIEINDTKYSRSTIKSTNWNAKWEAGFEPVTVFYPGTNVPFVYLRASFHEPGPLGEFDIEITPKMSFGTGHHATTYLVIGQMSALDIKGKKVIDFGTGTGVLAILAEKMGASEILAIDNDEWSINNARENFERNGCSRITLLQAGEIPVGSQADIIIANINMNIIIENIPVIDAASARDATLVFSGVLASDEPAILKALGEKFTVTSCAYKDGWMLICAKKGATS